MWAYLARSTLKREFASSLTFWFVAMATYLIVKAPTWDQSYRLLSDCLPYVMAMATAAFGADFVAKQTNIAGPPQENITTPPGNDPKNGDGNQ